jgi:hypothetical protein
MTTSPISESASNHKPTIRAGGMMVVLFAAEAGA